MARLVPRPMGGILNLNKPSGMTSRDAVDAVVRSFRGLKVGHAGTLDPLASGVLVVCVGAATRLVDYVQQMSKTYRTVIRLGARSDTLDADGQVVEVHQPRVPAEAEVRASLAGQVGTIRQIPPQFSALKVEGRRAYDLARAGRSVELADRPVIVYRIDLRSYVWPHLEVEVDCGKGTYIRSIARDVGEALGCGGLVEVLVRTRIGPFTLEQAVGLESLSADAVARLRPAAEAVAALPRREVSADEVGALLQGRPLRVEPGADVSLPAAEVALFGPDGTLVAIAEHEPGSGCIWPRRVLAMP